MTGISGKRVVRVLVVTVLAAVTGITTKGFSAAPATQPATQPRFRVGHIDDPRLTELSGLVPCRKQPGVYWGHNDSGNPAELFAVTRDGRVTAQVPVVGAPNVDWEDIAFDEQGHLYLSDMGNNLRNRDVVYLYRFDEPDPKDGQAPIRPTAYWAVHHAPGKAFDCESLFIWKGYAYLLPKLRNLGVPALYRFPLDEKRKDVRLEKVGDVPCVHGPVTAADVTTDGKWLTILTVLGPYVIQIDGDPANAVRPATTAAGHAAFFALKMESACFVKEGILAGTEEGDLYLFDWAELGMRPITVP